MRLREKSPARKWLRGNLHEQKVEQTSESLFVLVLGFQSLCFKGTGFLLGLSACTGGESQSSDDLACRPGFDPETTKKSHCLVPPPHTFLAAKIWIRQSSLNGSSKHGRNSNP